MANPATIRAVAEAICKSRTCEGVHCCQWPAQGGRTKCPVRDGHYDDAALAAILVLHPIATVTGPATLGAHDHSISL